MATAESHAEKGWYLDWRGRQGMALRPGFNVILGIQLLR